MPFDHPWRLPLSFSEVRVLDVDALPLEELHRAFMYTMVRRRPAEVGAVAVSQSLIYKVLRGSVSQYIMFGYDW